MNIFQIKRVFRYDSKIQRFKDSKIQRFKDSIIRERRACREVRNMIMSHTGHPM